MTDRRGALLALVLIFGLSLAGGYSYAAFSDEERVGITIDASGLDGSDDVDAADRPTPTEPATPTAVPTDSGTPTGTETVGTSPTGTTPTTAESPTSTPTDSPTPTPESPGGGTTEPG